MALIISTMGAVVNVPFPMISQSGYIIIIINKSTFANSTIRFNNISDNIACHYPQNDKIIGITKW